MAKLLLLLLAVASGGALAQYRWVDDKGRVQYTDTPPPASAKGVQKKSFAPNSAAKDKEEDKTAAQLRAAVEKNPIKLYTISNCDIGCGEARAYLNARSFPFTEVNVNNKEALAELKAVSGGEFIPVLAVGKRVHSGFDAAVYDGIFDGAGYPPRK